MDSPRAAFGHFRLTGEASMRVPALTRPTFEELQERFPWIKAIEHDISPEESVNFTLATVLRESEVRIGGEVLLVRLASIPRRLLLGYQHVLRIPVMWAPDYGDVGRTSERSDAGCFLQ